MKQFYTLTLVFACLSLSLSSSAQTYSGGTYTAVQPGNWHTASGPGIWQAAEPPQNCSNCLIVLNVPGTVYLNTSVTLSGASQLVVGSTNPTTLQIGNSNPSAGFSTSNNIILANDGTNSVISLAGSGAVVNAAGSGSFDGALISFSDGTTTSYFKEIGETPGFFQGNSIAGPGVAAGHGNTLTGPVTLSSTGTLPIILADFSTSVANGAIDLAWTTEMEINSDHFVVQSSTSAGASWNNIATLAAHGNSAIAINYSYTDSKPATGTSEYRLQMVDRDGKYAYSPVKAVRIGLISSVSLYPNPARDYVNVVLSGDASVSANIRLLNQSGQLLMEKNVSNAGGTTVPLSVSGYPQGNYLILVTASDGVQQVSKVFISK
jgi:hypothetical protein